MNGITWLPAAVAVFGFLPLGIYVYKRRLVLSILKKGISTRAIVYKITTRSVRSQYYDIVYYYFTASDRKQYAGVLSIKQGTYRLNDTVEIYYLPANPKRNTVKGAWGSPAILIFLILLTVFVLFAVYKVYEMMQSGAA
jgi:hypothetical protein